MTQYEFVVKTWLTRHNVDFDFQSTDDGGRAEWGGIDAPFVLPGEGIVLRIDPQQPEIRSILENEGYRVVDIETIDIETNLETVMLRAVSGEEMSPITSGLHTGKIYASKGFSPYPADSASVIYSSQVTPAVTTNPSVGSTLNGTLDYDGGSLCKSRFMYRACTLGGNFPYTFPFAFADNCQKVGYFPYTFPFLFYDAQLQASMTSYTNWQNGFKTTDTFDDTLSVSGSYSFAAQAKNNYASGYGAEKTVII